MSHGASATWQRGRLWSQQHLTCHSSSGKSSRPGAPDARECAGAQTQHQAQGHLLAFPGLLRSLITWVSVLVVLSLPSIVGETRGIVRLKGMPGATGAGSATRLRRKAQKEGSRTTSPLARVAEPRQDPPRIASASSFLTLLFFLGDPRAALLDPDQKPAPCSISQSWRVT